MISAVYRKRNAQIGQREVIVEYPTHSERDGSIEREVKEILTGVLEKKERRDGESNGSECC